MAETFAGANGAAVHETHRSEGDDSHSHEHYYQEPQLAVSNVERQSAARERIPTDTNQIDSNVYEETESSHARGRIPPPGKSFGHKHTPSSQMSNGLGINKDNGSWVEGLAFSPPPTDHEFPPSVPIREYTQQSFNSLASMAIDPHYRPHQEQGKTMDLGSLGHPFDNQAAEIDTVYLHKHQHIATLLIPLPFALMSLLPLRSEGVSAREGLPGLSTMTVAEVFLVTSITLTLMGCYTGLSNSKQSRRYVVLPNLLNIRLSQQNTLAQIILGGLAVFLPFYSASKLGNVRVPTFLLSATIMGIVGKSKISSEKLRMSELYRLFGPNRLLTAGLSLQICTDLLGLTSDGPLQTLFAGYLTLALSICLLPMPFVSNSPRLSSKPDPRPNGAATLGISRFTLNSLNTLSAKTTIASGTLSFLTAAVFYVTSSQEAIAQSSLHPFGLASIGLAAAVATSLSPPLILRSKYNIGFAVALAVPILFNWCLGKMGPRSLAIEGGLAIILWALACLGEDASTGPRQSGRHEEFGTAKSHNSASSQPSVVSQFLIARTVDWPIIHSILAEDDSRPVFYFMLLNLTFMGIQAFYSVVTESLGLLSDSIHMFFDCFALAVGLAAAVMSKWPPSARFPYGYGMLNVLAGFGNGVFLMLISIEIVYEAFERLVEGVEMNRLKELFVVSLLGMLINLIGLVAMPHHHHHHHDGHEHDHAHSHNHSHSHSHSHSHDHTHEHTHSHTHSHPHECDHDHGGHYQHNDGSHVGQHHGHNHSQGGDQKYGHDFGHTSQDPHLHNMSENLGTYDQHILDRNASLSTDLAKSVPLGAVDINASSASRINPKHLQTHSHGQKASPVPTLPSLRPHSHEGGSHHHGHHHGHDHMNENMLGIWLHIAADALARSYWDPLASILIAALIFASAIPLVKSCATRLLLANPSELEFDLKEALQALSSLRGIEGVCVPKFWRVEGEESRKKTHGVLHVIAGSREPLDDIRERAETEFRARGMNVLVQVERESEGRCWCGGGRFKT